MSDIVHAYPLILNKVASPHYATPTLRRPRLIEWLNDASPGRATVIAADAGYGKTTLLWQWEREADVPCYWYKLDRNDRDWTFHISYLIEAVSKRHKGFGRRAHSMLQQLGGPGSSRPGVAAYLLAEMHERLTEPCTFIIDDWQYVNAVTEVRGLWNQILRDAPPTCRFVFASRVKPKLQFARFKTHGGYAELRTDALRFTEPEIDELFRDIYIDPLEPSELAELERRTEGWAASLQLVEVSLRERTSPEDRREFIESITATSDSDLFDFLAEEVLDQQSEETRNFLLTTSILQQITPEVAERLAGVHDGQRELDGLEHRGLFTNRLDEHRYRYHNLFREFLERRLVAERSDAEVVGLHIHAASYFETTEQWPESIHHYLRAGLQRQAARLIAKYGEDVVSSGRLGLVDEWLQQLPWETVRQNARLSLLYGEACGIRGDWDAAIESLTRSREYFARKGDKRMDSLACLKLSSVYSNAGDAERAAEVVEAGLAIVPTDAVSTRLRLQGNLAVTRRRLTGSLADVVRDCQRVVVEAAAAGYEHFAAIGHHNIGEASLRMGLVDAAITHLERADRFWAKLPTSPFGDREDLTSALVVAGHPDRAESLAREAVRRCAPWPRPKAFAQYGLAGVLAAVCQFDEGLKVIREATNSPSVLGSGHAVTYARLIELLFLSGAPSEEIIAAYSGLAHGPIDPRLRSEVSASLAIVTHVQPDCGGRCQHQLQELAAAEAVGARLVASVARVKIGSLALDHSSQSGVRMAVAAVAAANADGFLSGLRPWVRRYVGRARALAHSPGGADLLASLLTHDPEHWREPAIGVLDTLGSGGRSRVLAAVLKHANRDTVSSLQRVSGADVTIARRQLQQAQAARLYLRTLGGISLRRGSWRGPAISIDKRRARALLAVLAAHAHTTLSRDVAVDILWPDADGDAAVNSLNQTVFQLRRFLDPSYRQGESPEYILSSSDHIGLNPELVRTDIDAVRRLPQRISSANWSQRQAIASSVISLVEGEFLADLRYETWTSRLQLSIHNDVRARLLPIAQQAGGPYDIQVAMDAAAALLRIDPFDETSTILLAEGLALSGRRVAARELLVRYAEQYRAEFEEDPSDAIVEAAGAI